jgi:uncharacterized membrane protein (DUF106 family)
MAFANLLDPLLNPLLSLGAFWTIFIISVFVSLFTVITYKYTTNQDHLRHLKSELKRLQEKSKKYTKEGKGEKALKLQKDMMKLNGQYMKHSMKSTLYTFIPLIIFFGWLGANLAFAPLMPGVPFNVSVQPQTGITGQFVLEAPDGFELLSNASQPVSQSITWVLKANSSMNSGVTIRHLPSNEEQFVPLIITTGLDYEEPFHKIDSSKVFSSIIVGNEKLMIFKGIPLFGQLPWISTWGWFGAYFLFSILFSTLLRKAMKLA